MYSATYDSRGLLATETDALGYKTTHAYTLHGSSIHTGIKTHTISKPLSSVSAQSVKSADTTQEFDKHGNLIASTNALGHTFRQEYDAQNRLLKTTGPDGTVIESLTYTKEGQIATRTDALGATTTYGYDQNGNRTSITDALGNVTKHEYDLKGNRTSTTDALGHTTRHEYDAGGRLTATILPEVSQPETLNLKPEPNEVRQTASGSPQGSEAHQTQSSSPSPSALCATRYTYDFAGRKLTTTAPDGTVTEANTYDALGRLTSRTNALGHTTRYEYDVKRGSTGCLSCSTSGLPTRIISPDGRITERVYDADRHLITETLAAGTPAAATTKHTYDLAGNRLSTTDPLGRVTRFEYDAANRRTAVIHPDNTQRTFAYNANGQLIAETDELGLTTKREHDAYGNLIAVTDAAGNTTRTIFGSGDESSPKTKADDSSALQGYAALHRPTGTVSAAGIRTQIDYDMLGRRVAMTKAPGTVEAATTRHEFDAVGNEIASITNIGPEPQGAVASSSPPTATGAAANTQPRTANSEQRTVHTYDARRRRITTTDALNRTWRFVYNDAAGPSGPAPCCGADPTTNTRATEIIHPDGSREQKTYNAQGQLIATTDAKGDSVKYGYDAAGRLTELTDANGHSTKWRYDARGKLAAKTYPDQSTELYEHDAAGQMISRVRPDGTSARYDYDDRSRLLKIEWSDGKTENSTFAYDKAGHLTLAQNKSAIIQRSYNMAGRMAQETQQISSPVAVQLEKPFTAAVGYQYDADGRLAKLTYPDQTTVAYRYNERGELKEVEDAMPPAPGSKPGAAAYTRRPDGKITQLALPNGTVTTKTYDAVGRLSEIKHVDPAGNTLFSEASRYDLKNRRTARVQADGSADLFAYDPAGQVTAAAYGQAIDATGSAAPEKTENSEPRTANWQQTFEYDPAGNRLEATDHGTTTKYTPNAANQYTAVATGTQIVEPQFDKLGNLLRDDKNTYTWDADIHLLSVASQSSIQDQASSLTRFAYDALHRRVARLDADSTLTHFVHDGWNVISEYTSSPSLPISKSPSLRLVWGHDLSGTAQGAGGIAGLLKTTGNQEQGAEKYFSYDSNGNVVVLTNRAGVETARYSYDAFGKTLTAAGEAAQSNKYRFSTKPIEEASGLAYYGYRYYSPELGRWPSRDPIGESGGINLFCMLSNSVVGLHDFLGLAWPRAERDGFVNDPVTQIVDQIFDAFDQGMTDMGAFDLKNDKAHHCVMACNLSKSPLGGTGTQCAGGMKEMRDQLVGYIEAPFNSDLTFQNVFDASVADMEANIIGEGCASGLLSTYDSCVGCCDKFYPDKE